MGLYVGLMLFGTGSGGAETGRAGELGGSWGAGGDNSGVGQLASCCELWDFLFLRRDAG